MTFAWCSLNGPLITSRLPNGENEAWVGWVIGADTTCPPTTTAIMAWNCCWARCSTLSPAAGQGEIYHPLAVGLRDFRRAIAF